MLYEADRPENSPSALTFSTFASESLGPWILAGHFLAVRALLFRCSGVSPVGWSATAVKAVAVHVAGGDYSARICAILSSAVLTGAGTPIQVSISKYRSKIKLADLASYFFFGCKISASSFFTCVAP